MMTRRKQRYEHVATWRGGERDSDCEGEGRNADRCGGGRERSRAKYFSSLCEFQVESNKLPTVPVIILSFLLKCLRRCLWKEDRQPSGKPTRVNQTVSTIDGTIVLAIILFNILVSLLYVELPFS